MSMIALSTLSAIYLPFTGLRQALPEVELAPFNPVFRLIRRVHIYFLRLLPLSKHCVPIFPKFSTCLRMYSAIGRITLINHTLTSHSILGRLVRIIIHSIPVLILEHILPTL